MTQGATTYLLHLGDRSLRWLALRRHGRSLTLQDQGETVGPPIECLDRWAADHLASPASVPEVVLYDSRPRYYSFAMQMPASAARRAGEAAGLRVRQELGVDGATLAWSTRVVKSPERGVPLDLFTVVVRVEALADVRDWARRHHVSNLWVGADLDAVRTVIRADNGAKEGDGPLVVLNEEAGGAAVYLTDAEGRTIRQRIVRGGLANGRLVLPQVGAGARRLAFGTLDIDWLRGLAPELAGLPESPVPALDHPSGRASARLEAAAPDRLRRDAVLAGGLLTLLTRSSFVADSLLGALEPESPQAEAAALAAQPAASAVRRWAWCAAVALAMLAAALATLTVVSKRAVARLQARADEVAGPAAILQSELDGLRMIQSQRDSLLPVIEAVHDAAPAGMFLKSLEVTDSGELRLECSTNNRNNAADFMGALAASPLLANVKLPMEQPAQRGVTFQITARVRSRAVGQRR